MVACTHICLYRDRYACLHTHPFVQRQISLFTHTSICLETDILVYTHVHLFRGRYPYLHTYQFVQRQISLSTHTSTFFTRNECFFFLTKYAPECTETNMPQICILAAGQLLHMPLCNLPPTVCSLVYTDMAKMEPRLVWTFRKS